MTLLSLHTFGWTVTAGVFWRGLHLTSLFCHTSTSRSQTCCSRRGELPNLLNQDAAVVSVVRYGEFT